MGSPGVQFKEMVKGQIKYQDQFYRVVGILFVIQALWRLETKPLEKFRCKGQS